MSWVKQALTSSIGRKLVMSLTGLFLVVFLVAHLSGNISLLFADGGVAFNEYAHFMKHNKLIVASEVFLFIGFFVHIVQGIMLYNKNKSARSQGYVVPHKNEKVSWTSKYMGPFGMVILVFFIVHLWDFFSFKYFRTPTDLMINGEFYLVDGAKIADLYKIVHDTYSSSLLHVILYPIAMLVVGLHLSHGFQSAFQSLGINHKKYSPFIKGLGTAYSIIIPLLFALIPIFIKLGILF